MKINIFKYIVLFLLIIITLIIYLSLAGIETERFNNQIKNKVLKTNKNFLAI